MKDVGELLAGCTIYIGITPKPGRRKSVSRKLMSKKKKKKIKKENKKKQQKKKTRPSHSGSHGDITKTRLFK